MLRVIRKHRAAVGNIDGGAGARRHDRRRPAAAWDEALALGEQHGYRNAQATVLAPTGTISFMMDCDTTGIEPDFSLVKSKKLVGGGDITIVNQTVPTALAKLGYAPHEIDQIVAYVNEHNTVVGAPALQGRAPVGVRRGGRRPGDPPHGPRQDDGAPCSRSSRARSRRP